MRTLDDVRQVKERIEAEILKRPGVTGIDVGYSAAGGTQVPVIRISVANAAAREQANIPREIEGVPVEIIERVFRLH